MDSDLPCRLFPSRDRTEQGYAPLTSDFEAFYTRRMYSRIEDCWNRPITGTPGAWLDVLERKFLHQTWLRDAVYVPAPLLAIGARIDAPSAGRFLRSPFLPLLISIQSNNTFLRPELVSQ